MPTDATPSREVRTADPAETMALAARLASVAAPGDVIALIGDLGAGKTVFAKGFGAGLGVEGSISSPSFILMTEHEGRLPLFHLDLYRLADAADAVAGGLLDERQGDGVTMIEWADRLGTFLPSARLEVEILSGDGTGDGDGGTGSDADDRRAADELPSGAGAGADGPDRSGAGAGLDRLPGEPRRILLRATDPGYRRYLEAA